MDMRYRDGGMTLLTVLDLVRNKYQVDVIHETKTITDRETVYVLRYQMHPDVQPSVSGYIQNLFVWRHSRYRQLVYESSLVPESDSILVHTLTVRKRMYKVRRNFNALELLPNELLEIIIGFIESDPIEYYDGTDEYMQRGIIFKKDQIRNILCTVARPELWRKYQICFTDVLDKRCLFDIGLIEQCIAENPNLLSYIITGLEHFSSTSGSHDGWYSEFEFMECVRKHVPRVGILMSELTIGLLRRGELSLLERCKVDFELNVHCSRVADCLFDLILREGRSVEHNLAMMDRRFPAVGISKWFKSFLKENCTSSFGVFDRIEDWDLTGDRFLECFRMLETWESEDGERYEGQGAYWRRCMFDHVLRQVTYNYVAVERLNRIYESMPLYRKQILKQFRGGLYFPSEERESELELTGLLRMSVIADDEYIMVRFMLAACPDSSKIKKIIRNWRVVNAPDAYGQMHPGLVYPERDQIVSDYDVVVTVYEWMDIGKALDQFYTRSETKKWYREESVRKGVNLPKPVRTKDYDSNDWY